MDPHRSTQMSDYHKGYSFYFQGEHISNSFYRKNLNLSSSFSVLKSINLNEGATSLSSHSVDCVNLVTDGELKASM